MKKASKIIVVLFLVLCSCYFLERNYFKKVKKLLQTTQKITEKTTNLIFSFTSRGFELSEEFEKLSSPFLLYYYGTVRYIEEWLQVCRIYHELFRECRIEFDTLLNKIINIEKEWEEITPPSRWKEQHILYAEGLKCLKNVITAGREGVIEVESFLSSISNHFEKGLINKAIRELREFIVHMKIIKKEVEKANKELAEVTEKFKEEKMQEFLKKIREAALNNQYKEYEKYSNYDKNIKKIDTTLTSSIVIHPRYENIIIKEKGFVGEIFKDTSCGVICYVDMEENKFYSVKFVQERTKAGDILSYRPCVLSEETYQIIKYLDHPYEGEKIIFLTNNKKVGEGIADSIGFGGLSDFQGVVRCKILEGKIGNLVISNSLYRSCKQRLILEAEECSMAFPTDSTLIFMVISYLRDKRINTNILTHFQITDKLYGLLTPEDTMCLVTMKAGIKCPKTYKELVEKVEKKEVVKKGEDYVIGIGAYSYHISAEVVESDYNEHPKKYIVNAIMLKKGGKTYIDFLTASYPVNIYTVGDLLDSYYRLHNLYYISIDGKILKHPRPSPEINSFIDWVDIDGDLVAEVVVKYLEQEGFGSIILKRINNKWKEISSYYLGV